MAESLSINSEMFLSTVREALTQQGELLVLHQRAYWGGDKYWFIVRKWDDFLSVLNTKRIRSAFTVFLKPELPLRGIADTQLQTSAESLLAGCGELLLAATPAEGLELDSLGTDELDDVREFFNEKAGKYVLIGRFPPFWLENGDECIGAYMPDADGRIRPGSY